MLGNIVFERVGTKMVREHCDGAGSHEIRELETEHAQSIIGATLKRRDGSGLVVLGFVICSRDIGF